MNIKLEHGFAKSPEKAHWDGKGEMSCLKVDGLYNLKIGFFWVVENKKRISTINRWLKNNGYKTIFVDEANDL